MLISTLKAFLLVFHSGVPRQTITDYLDTRPEVLDWLSPFPNAVFIVSRGNVRELQQVIHQQFSTLFFCLAEVGAQNADGWLPPNVWDFVNNPKSSGKWDLPPPLPPSSLPDLGLPPTKPPPKDLSGLGALLLGGATKSRTCPDCKGTGRSGIVPAIPCFTCRGKGEI